MSSVSRAGCSDGHVSVQRPEAEFQFCRECMPHMTMPSRHSRCAVQGACIRMCFFGLCKCLYRRLFEALARVAWQVLQKTPARS